MQGAQLLASVSQFILDGRGTTSQLAMLSWTFAKVLELAQPRYE
jgi:hypothetical protein